MRDEHLVWRRAFGALFRALREERKLSRSDVAMSAGLAHSSVVTAWETGRVTPWEHAASAYARALSVEPQKLQTVQRLAREFSEGSPPSNSE